MNPLPFPLFVYWPGTEPPRVGPVARAVGPAREDEPIPVPRALWTKAWRWPEQQRFLCAWAGYVDDLPGGIGLSALSQPDSIRRQLQRTLYYLGLVTALPAADVPGGYERLLRTCLDSCPDTPAVYDGASFVLRSGPEVRALAEAEARLPPRELYRVEGILPDEGGEGLWIHTHGLERAGFPDVEVLDVPPTHGEAAASLVHVFVERYFGKALPRPGQPIDVLPQAELVWLPLEVALHARCADDTGGACDRRAGGHGGWRIVLAELEGDAQDRWTPPLAALGALDCPCRACAGVAKSKADTDRARKTWSRFARLFVDHGRSSAWRFLARIDVGKHSRKGALPVSWQVVRAVRRSGVRSRPLSSRAPSPRFRWHPLDRLLDWQIITPWGLIDPHSSDGAPP